MGIPNPRAAWVATHRLAPGCRLETDVFVEEKAQLHAALASKERDCFTCLRQ
jgi:hypothetical protein